MGTRNSYTSVIGAAAFALCAFGCGGSLIPPSIRAFAADLPARADGQYALLDEPIRKQLVMKDALLQCSVDQSDGVKEADSPACQCSTSAHEDWAADCKAWLREHAPPPMPPEPTAVTPNS
jgi:hypothetical protein